MCLFGQFFYMVNLLGSKIYEIRDYDKACALLSRSKDIGQDFLTPNVYNFPPIKYTSIRKLPSGIIYNEI